MSKAAFIILAASDTRESLGRVVNALMGALEYIESDGDVQIIFDGAGTQAAAEFAKADHNYHELFERIRSRISGVCSYCAGAFKVKDKIEEANLPFTDQFKGHPSFKHLLEQGFAVMTF
jgi:hypothetical protein